MKNLMRNDELADPGMSEKQPVFMEQFFNEVERAKAATNRIKGATSEIRTLKDQAVTAIGNDAEQLVSQKLAQVLTQANKDAALAKRVLENLKAETEKLERKKFQADVRVRENIHSTCLQNLVVTVRGYQQAQQDYRAALQEKGVRQIKVVKPEATDKEVESVIQGGDVNAVYREAILQPGSDPLAQAYLHVVDKYQDVLKLEKSVEELHAMFLDLAVLVDAQGEMLDNIEHQVTMAKDYMAQGNKNLQSALKARKATRRRMCCCVIILVIVLIVILGPLMSSLK